MPRYTTIPEIPLGVPLNWQLTLLGAIKENVELMAGLRGEASQSSMALTRDVITVKPVDEQNMRQTRAIGRGYNIKFRSDSDGVDCAALDDYTKLIEDVQQLANDVAYNRKVLNTLIKQLRG